MDKKSVVLLVIAIIILAVAVVFATWSFNFDSQVVNEKSVVENKIVEEQIENKVVSEETEFSESDYKEESKTKSLKATYTDFSVKDKNGNEIKLSDYKDSPVMILFWNNQNEDSIEMLKRLNEQYTNYENEIKFIVINSGEEYQVEGVTLPIYQDTNNKISKLYNVTEFPGMIYINKENEVFYAKTGLTTKDALKANLDILAENFQ